MKVLREISVKDGLPKTDGIYTVHIHEDPHTSAIYFFTEGNIWGGGVISFGVTSWYEEVDLEILFTEYKFQKFEEFIKPLAKERYEKALLVKLDLETYFSPDEKDVINHIEYYFIEALKIAAGLE